MRMYSAAVAGLLLLGSAAVPGQEPPPGEVYLGKALNGLLQQLVAAHSQGRRGPKVTLDAALLAHINLTSERGGNFGLLKNGGKLNWPPIFADKSFRGDRARTEEIIGTALRQLRTDPTKPLGNPMTEELAATVKRLLGSLMEKVGDLSPSEYITARRHLNRLQDAVRVLGNPDAAKYLDGTYAARGETMADLVEHMKRQGLRFAPAVPGEEKAYQALYAALVKYRAGLPPPR